MNLQHSSDGAHFKYLNHYNSNKLAIFFSGTDKTEGKFDFWNVGNSLNCHKLFFNNGSNEWYQRGIIGFGDSIHGTVEKIRSLCKEFSITEVFLVGVSMGGYGAILFGALLNAKILAFGFDSKLKITGSRSAKRLPKDIKILYDDLRPVIENSDCHVTQICGECDALDLYSASRIFSLKNVKSISLRGIGHGSAPFINENYNLVEYISNWMNNDAPFIIESVNSVCSIKLTNSIYQAYLAYARKSWDEVDCLCRNALLLSPYHEYINFMLGTALLERNLAEEALGPLYIAVGVAPHYPAAQYRLARALMKLKNFSQAQYHLEIHVRQNPTSTVALLFLSDVHYELKNYKLAFLKINEAIQLGATEDKTKKRLEKLGSIYC
ncbi:alpha/beta hydrolase [Rahnella bruchi]|uniref:alpha/beta hydrolase n=1 Tax=Rahnella bruchi TaxID=1510573 RepID=UPI000EA28281|nr:alpha/beta hydrolase [Rahnella bruchi]